MSAAAPTAELTVKQRRNARIIYNEARAKGLSRQRAIELVVAAWNESRLDEEAQGPPVAQYGGRRAAGLFQLLSDGYVRTARALGGVFDPRANTRAILPDYLDYWRRHPTAEFGAAARDVERSGMGADFYRRGRELFGWLDDRTAKSASAGAPVNVRRYVSGDTAKLDPDLLARLWLLGLHLGRRIDVGSGYRSHAEQQALYAAYVARGKKGAPVAVPGRSNHEKGQAADAKIGGRHLGDVVDDATLRAFGLKVLRSINEPWHVEPVAARPYNPESGSSANLASFIPGVAGALPPNLREKLGDKLRGLDLGTSGLDVLEKGGEAARDVIGAGGEALAEGIGAGLERVFSSYPVKFFGLWLLLTILGLAFVLIGVLRLVGLRPSDAATVALKRGA